MTKEKLYKESELQEELRSLLNRHCQENESDTSDFILAEYLLDCLKSYNKAVKRRDKWWGVKMSIGGSAKQKNAKK
jgi:hypothetical protein